MIYHVATIQASCFMSMWKNDFVNIVSHPLYSVSMLVVHGSVEQARAGGRRMYFVGDSVSRVKTCQSCRAVLEDCVSISSFLTSSCLASKATE